MDRRFRLEPILTYRESLEEAAKSRLAERQRELRDEQERLQAFHQERQRVDDDLARHQLEKVVDTQMLFLGFLYRDYVVSQIEEQMGRIQLAEARVEEQRQVLIAAVKNRKVIDKLKENHQIAYGKWVDQVEVRVLDDVAVAQFHRNRQGEST